MNIIQCSICKKPFQSYGRKQCPACIDYIDECFILVRDYLDQYPNAGMETVEAATEVDQKIILHLLKEGRLIMGEGKAVGSAGLICEMCKKPISTGKLCNSCKDNLSNTISNSKSQLRKEEKVRLE